MQALIEAVRRHPCLWNPLHPDYREPVIKDSAWQTIVEQLNNMSISIPNRGKRADGSPDGKQKPPPMDTCNTRGITIQTAKAEWKKLRDNHRDALKRAKLGKNKLLPAQITTWKYAKAMQFLEPHMKYRVTENIEVDTPIVALIKSSDQDVSTTNTNSMPTYSATENIVKITRDNSKKRRYLEQTSDLDTTFRQETDSLQSFFNCILQSTREMPQWMQTQVKKKIFAVVIEAEEYLSSQSQDFVEQSEQIGGIVEDTEIKVEPEVKCEINEDSSDINY